MKSLVPETEHLPDLSTDVALQTADLASRRDRSRGQSLVEFAVIMPIVAFLLLGILDFSRVFTSIMTVESAAREAADYGSWRSGNWAGSPLDSDSARFKTEAGIRSRACLASSNLPDFDGDAAGCTNPSVQFDLLDHTGSSALNPTGNVLADCDEAVRKQGQTVLDPCRVKVDLTFTFDLVIPLGFEFAGVRYGLPPDITFTRTSIFAISDFSIDQ